MKKVVAYLLALFMVLTGTYVGGTVSYAATKSISANDIIVLQTYIEEGGEDGDIPHVLIFDGDSKKVLVEGTDYELKQIDYDDWEEELPDDGEAANYYTYHIQITGKGSYSGERMAHTDYYGELKEDSTWEYLLDSENDVSVALHYKGSATKVTIPETLPSRNGNDTEVVPGMFLNNNTLEEIDATNFWLVEYMCVNCPKVTKITTDMDGDYVSEYPGPVSYGNHATNVKLEVSFTFVWTNDVLEDAPEVGIEEYCDKYNWITYSDQSADYQEGGFKFRIDAKNESAILVSYNGSDAKVNVPQYIEFDEEEYYVDEISEGAFSNLSTLEEINLGELPIVVNMVNNCKNLKKITSENMDDIELDGNVVVGYNPSSSKVVLSTYSGVYWELDTEDETVVYPIQQYCDDYGYTLVPLASKYSDYSMVTEHGDCIIAGDTLPLDFICYATGSDEEYEMIDVDPDMTVSGWEVVEGNKTAISDDGKLTAPANISRMEAYIVKCNAVFKGSEITVYGQFNVYPRLWGKKDQVLIPGDSLQLSCKQYAYSSGYGLNTLPIDESVPVVYEVENPAKLSVTDAGVVTTKDGVQAGEVIKAKATYTIDGVDYSYIFNITIGEREDVVIDGDPINIYGWEGSGMHEKIEGFLDIYPSYIDKINYHEIEDIDFEDAEEWQSYKNRIATAMKGSEKPDIIFWPESKVYGNLPYESLVSLEQIGYDKTKYNGYPYTKARGTYNGKLYAVTDTVDPGIFVYRKDIATEVFGTDSPEAVQNAISDWKKFMASAAKVKEKNYFMLSNLEIDLPLFGGKTTPWITDGTLDVSLIARQYIKLQKDIYVNGYVQETADYWDSYKGGSIDYKTNSFGFFASADILSDPAFISKSSQYDFCAGPQYYALSDTAYMTATNVGHNDALTKFVLEKLTCDSIIMKHNMQNDLGMMNNSAAMKSYITNNPNYKVPDVVASKVDSKSYGADDYDIEYLLTDEFDISYWPDEAYDLSVDKISKIDVNTKTAEIIPLLKEILPDVNIEMSEVDDDDDPVNPDKDKDDKKENPKHDKHTYGKWTVVTEPMCDRAGLKQRKCTVCGQIAKTAIPATGFIKNGKFVRNGLVFKILSVKGKKGNLSFIGLETPKKSKVNIPAKIKAGGKTFTVTTIGNNACKANINIKTVIIPKTVKKIGKEAFSGCKKLRTLTIKTTKLKKKTIGKNAVKNI
nr:leucine-rich repeat protein [Eubacterium sp.]